MKKKDKKIAGVIKEQLAMFEKNNPLPEELSREKVTELLKEQQTPTPKKRTVMQYRRLISIPNLCPLLKHLPSVTAKF
ncbi:MAG: hypothetical protein ACOYJX_06250 [Acutalibacteraceae bacterium]|jgi:DNA-directed RNA polymerase specialized sigma54-like protein